MALRTLLSLRQCLKPRSRAIAQSPFDHRNDHKTITNTIIFYKKRSKTNHKTVISRRKPNNLGLQLPVSDLSDSGSPSLPILDPHVKLRKFYKKLKKF